MTSRVGSAYLYWDSSAILSALLEDAHSAVAVRHARRTGLHLVSSLGWSEVSAVLTRMGRERYLTGVLVASAFGSFLISLIYAILCVGAVRMFLQEGTFAKGAVPALLGFLISAGGIVAQFISGLAPTGTALQGRNLAVAGLVVVLLWLVYNVMRRPEAVDAAGQHALQHRLTEADV